MDPLTHALTGWTLSRAGLKNVAPLALPMLLASSLAADLDWLASLGGPRAFLHGNRTVTHSLIGTAALVVIIAALFWWLRRDHPRTPLRFLPALALCAIGAGAHLLMDLANSYGVKLLWPFQQNWYSGDFVDYSDLWMLVIFFLGLTLPALFRMITEEIGAKAKPRGTQRGAIIALLFVVLWIGGRWLLHDRAEAMIRARLYHGQTPLAFAVFPTSTSPLMWRAVVETENMLDVLDVPLAPGSIFDPMVSTPFYKPDPTPMLEAASNTALVKEFLEFARFPRVTLQKTEAGYRFELRDLRFYTWIPGKQVPRVVVELNQQNQVIDEKLYFSPSLVR